MVIALAIGTVVRKPVWLHLCKLRHQPTAVLDCLHDYPGFLGPWGPSGANSTPRTSCATIHTRPQSPAQLPPVPHTLDTLKQTSPSSATRDMKKTLTTAFACFITITNAMSTAITLNKQDTLAPLPAQPPSSASTPTLNCLHKLPPSLPPQDTLKQTSPGSATRDMKKALTTAMTTAFAFFITIAGTSYSALGDNVPGSVLDASWGGAVPKWVPLIANVLIFLHMVSAFQIYAQPLFQCTEEATTKLLRKLGGSCRCFWAPSAPPGGTEAAVTRWASSPSVIVTKGDDAHTSSSNPKTPTPGRKRRLLGRAVLRVVVRTVLVASAMILSVLVPSFSSVIGLVGALLYWPAGVLYPILLWGTVYRPGAGLRRAMGALNVLMLLVSVAGTVGSVYEIVRAARWRHG